MTKRDLLSFLFRHKTTLIGWWVLITALVAFLSFTNPQSYVASTSVLVERNKTPLIGPASLIVPEMMEAMNTEMHIILSRPVIESVVDEFVQTEIERDAEETPKPVTRMVEWGLESDVTLREAWIEELTRSIKVKPVVNSNILEIQYSNSDPNLAMLLANAVTDSYLSQRQRLQATRGGSEFLEDKLSEAESELRELRQSLTDFKTKNALSSPNEAKIQLIGEIGRLRERITDLNADRALLLNRYSDNHPNVMVVTENIVAAESDRANRERRLRGLESKQATIDELEDRILAQQEIVRTYQLRFEQESAREAVPENLTNVQVVEYATIPARPKYSRLFFIKVGAVGGFLIALLIAFMREYFNRKADTPEAAELALGIPVIGSIEKRAAIRRY